LQKVGYRVIPRTSPCDMWATKEESVMENGTQIVVGESESMQGLLTLVERVARSECALVVHGESGVGKDLLARAIHDASARREGPFVTLGAGVVTDELLQSALFGHVENAFTGACADRDGVFVQANGGTLYLDDVESMSERMQAALLRVLEDKAVSPLGSHEVIPVDVRVIVSCRGHLSSAVAGGTFRSDLYYRLSGFTLHVPPLRDRTEDLPALAAHLDARADRPALALEQSALDAMAQYPWPGNVRELENELQRLHLGGVRRVRRGDLSDHIREIRPSAPGSSGLLGSLSLREAVQRLEKEMIVAALARCRGNVTATARVLGVERTLVQRRIRAYDIEVSRRAA
jgi:two-component system NtrC family response regulator